MRSPTRFAIPIHLDPAVYDHRILDRPVLPAALALGVLADLIHRHVGVPLPWSEDALFRSFLDLPDPPGPPLSATIEVHPEDDGSFRASLLTRITVRHGSGSRVKQHVSARFTAPGQHPPVPPAIVEDLPGTVMKIEKEALYRELVPFGPAFRNLTGDLSLAVGGAGCSIDAPSILPDNPVLGSPFVFDAAMHAANVWTQKYAGIVAFPVGYASRCILEPTQGGGRYLCRAVPRASSPGVQEFDIWILDMEHRLREVVFGVRMRELFAGRLQPPAWLLGR